jgi:hypothetical protein
MYLTEEETKMKLVEIDFRIIFRKESTDLEFV